MQLTNKLVRIQLYYDEMEVVILYFSEVSLWWNALLGFHLDFTVIL